MKIVELIIIQNMVGKLDRNFFANSVRQSLLRNHADFELHHETNAILSTESRFSRSCSKFTGQKALTEFIRKKPCYIAPKTIQVGFDGDTAKAETVQYVSIFDTLQVILSHEDVIGSIIRSGPSSDG